MSAPHVVAVSRAGGHRFSKRPEFWIDLVAGIGVQGDAHAGATVRHRSRVARDPTQPNLRQVHLLQAELLDELNAARFGLAAGAIGENVLTRGIDLLGLPRGTRLALGESAVIEVTGLRNPCGQLDRHRPGLMAACLGRAADGAIIRRAGIMAVVEVGGTVRAGDAVGVILPSLPHRPLGPV